MNECKFKIGEQVLVEYANHVTYNATVKSLPQNGKIGIRWDSIGKYEEVDLRQYAALRQNSSVVYKRPTRKSAVKVSYNEQNTEFDQQRTQPGEDEQGNSL